MAKEALSKKKRILCSKLDLEFKKRLVRCFVWSVATHGAETWTLRKEDRRLLEALEMWIWRRMERISWTEKVRNEEVLQRVGEKRRLKYNQKEETELAGSLVGKRMPACGSARTN